MCTLLKVKTKNNNNNKNKTSTVQTNGDWMVSEMTQMNKHPSQQYVDVLVWSVMCHSGYE